MTTRIDLTPHADINELLELLLARIQGILGKKLIGLYIFGSFVTGDFDYESSDIDLVAALSADLDEKEFEGIKMMHADIALTHSAEHSIRSKRVNLFQRSKQHYGQSRNCPSGLHSFDALFCGGMHGTMSK